MKVNKQKIALNTGSPIFGNNGKSISYETVTHRGITRKGPRMSIQNKIAKNPGTRPARVKKAV